MRPWLVGSWLVAVVGCAAAPAAPPESPERRTGMPTPGRGRLEAAVVSNAECEHCHASEAREWRASLHARANEEPTYRRAFELEPLPFCRRCHAPEAVPTEQESAAVSALGVGCVTCHVTGDGVLAAPRDDAHAVRAPHAITRDPRFGGVQACASCHEFSFPTAPPRHPPRDAELMQSTVREHAASPANERSCADCHMPRGSGGRRSHAFAASRVPAIVQSAATVEARRTGPSRVQVTVSPTNPGHAFPTGDLFRRLEVLAEASGPDGIVLGRDVRYLTRHFVPRRGGVGRQLLADDRPRSEPVVVELDVGVAADIAWRVAYQRVEHPREVDDEAAKLDGEIVLGGGLLAR